VAGARNFEGLCGSIEKGANSMKTCKTCGNEVESLQHTCPRCGGDSFVSSDATDGYAAQLRQEEAKRHVDRGAELIQQGRPVDGERETRRAIEINPLNATAHANLAVLFTKRGQFEQAVPRLEKALELNPRLEGAREFLAWVKDRHGPRRRSWQFWRRRRGP